MRTRVVDHQAHWYPPAYFESILDRETPPMARRVDADTYVYVDALGAEQVCPPTFHALDVHQADMDAHDVDVAVLSPNLVGDVSRLPLEDAVSTAELLNAEIGKAQRSQPNRIVGLAMLPLQDPDAAIEVLGHAIDDHDLAGVCFLSNIAGAPIVKPELLPVYRELEQRNLPLFLHPAHSSVVDSVGYGPTINIGLGWMFETAAAALSLVYGGVLDACPDLVVVHPHLGGALPGVVDRVVECEIAVELRYPLRTYLQRNFFVDTVQKTPGAPGLAVATYGLDRLVFGTDFPWIERKGSADATRSALSPWQYEQVLANAIPNLRLPAAAVTGSGSAVAD
ncbi:MAG TPA: amidohydrolase family protein [Solirubrobacteraceae bacterium]|nr:amidohydrolase family protein [Solirubrobacteraceae bacterium]